MKLELYQTRLELIVPLWAEDQNQTLLEAQLTDLVGLAWRTKELAIVACGHVCSA